MEKFRAIQKGVFTSIVGLAIIGILCHRYYTTGEFEINEMLLGLAGLGLLFAKDQGSSHTK